jgi:hypothetical protein
VRKLEQYRIKDGKTPLNAEQLNFRILDIDGRLHALELLKVSWEQAVAEVQNYGLARINETLLPVLDQASALVADGQADLDGMNAQWQAILDEWDGIQGTLNGLQAGIDANAAAIATLQTDLADLEADLAAHLALPSDKLMFGQFGLVTDQADLACIPGGPRTLNQVKVLVTDAPSGGPCSIELLRNGTDAIFVSGSLDIADGAFNAITTNLQNNTIGQFDYILARAITGNGAKNFMCEIE